jgi:hypothetical protein
MANSDETRFCHRAVRPAGVGCPEAACAVPFNAGSGSGSAGLLYRTQAADQPRAKEVLPPVPKAKLWAGLGVTQPAMRADDVTHPEFFMVSFALANDRGKAIDPQIGSASKFLVNGKELKDWGLIK